MSTDPGQTGRLDEVLDDLAVESTQLESVVAGLDEAGWRSPTPAPGWDVATQIAHLAWTDEMTILAATGTDEWDQVARQAGDEVGALVERSALEGSAVLPARLLDRWRRSKVQVQDALRGVPAGRRVSWFGPPMSPATMATARFMETWAHSIDVLEALGIEPLRTDGVRHVALLGSIARGFSFTAHGRAEPEQDVHVSLVLPSGTTWSHGQPDARNAVTGSAYDFALCVTQRRHRDDLDLVARGPVAEEWLDVAQAFAGPPGAGRAPRRQESR